MARVELLCLNGPFALGERGAPRRKGLGIEALKVKAVEGPWSGSGYGTWRGSEGGTIRIQLSGGKEEVVDIDPVHGPGVLTEDGSVAFLAEGQQWQQLPTSDQKVLAYQAARRNVALKEKLGDGFFHAMAIGKALMDSPHDRIGARCRVELARDQIKWKPVTIELVQENHAKEAPGILYGIEFPWNEETLSSMGPEWLTRAFHAAGTLERSNRVTQLKLETKIKITGGNNAGKFLFEVEYQRDSPDLHKELFAKVPYAMTKETSSDRFSSSVYKQPMDLYEINTYRLLEAALPVKTPKYYYGDISCETSNFILITARIPFEDFKKTKSKNVSAKGALEPFEVEGPYDKCKDFQLRGDPKEYYLLLLKSIAKIAGQHKTGNFASEASLAANLGSLPADVSHPEHWGMKPQAPTGESPSTYRKKLDVAVTFFSETAAALYPSYVKEGSFKTKFINVMMTWSAYAAELSYWKIHNLDYVAIGHQNLNADNAYYWRNESGDLDCGVFDWGGMGMSNIGHKMWWTFNCADFDQVKDNLDEYIDTVISTYKESGGPALDRDFLKLAILITSIENTSFMCAAIPNCFKMCKSAEWPTITERSDPRIAENVDGKSTLRTTIHVLGNGLRALEEFGADKALEKWIREIYVGKWGNKAKDEAIIHGA